MFILFLNCFANLWIQNQLRHTTHFNILFFNFREDQRLKVFMWNKFNEIVPRNKMEESKKVTCKLDLDPVQHIHFKNSPFIKKSFFLYKKLNFDQRMPSPLWGLTMVILLITANAIRLLCICFVRKSEERTFIDNNSTELPLIKLYIIYFETKPREFPFDIFQVIDWLQSTDEMLKVQQGNR